MNTFISLPFGGTGAGFDTDDLIEHIKSSGRNYIIQGHETVGFNELRKKQGLDAWLRTNYTNRKDTMQAVTGVITKLEETGLFRKGKFICPESGFRAQGIEFIHSVRLIN